MHSETRCALQRHGNNVPCEKQSGPANVQMERRAPLAPPTTKDKRSSRLESRDSPNSLGFGGVLLGTAKVTELSNRAHPGVSMFSKTRPMHESARNRSDSPFFALRNGLQGRHEDEKSHGKILAVAKVSAEEWSALLNTVSLFSRTFR